ncbi:poly(R)-hydroxyalkanoic acid synthase subunit PhaE [Candidatus Poriferisodalis sp.]|uniref:poly(R)-hydroxyalkanoic acid synthase subunit PhaE n=1 Tax=Candidatus Poriferisodalis sp. TaxID=3101277 RepID=UPI003B529E07
MDKTEGTQNFDPLRTWREWYQKSEKQWSDALSCILGNDQFAQTTGKYVQEAMHLHRMFTESMAQYLAALNLPSRTDITALSDRVGELEDTVAGLQVEVRHVRRSLAEHDGAAQADGVPVRPKRTKQPHTCETN